MSKKKKAVAKEVQPVDKLETIPKRYRDFIAAIIIVLPLLYYFIPYITNNVEPSGSDFLASKGQKHLYKEWEAENDETVLWNPNIFSGEPIYYRVLPKRIDMYFVLEDIDDGSASLATQTEDNFGITKDSAFDKAYQFFISIGEDGDAKKFRSHLN